MMASISISLDSTASTPSVAPDFDNEEEFYDFLGWSNYPEPPETVDDDNYFEYCKKSIFEDSISQGMYFPPFENTSPIIAAHEKVWRGGHTNNILSLVIGTKEDSKSYLTGLVVSAVTVLIIFIAWMALLITLRGFGSKRVGFLSGRRAKFPQRPKDYNENLPDDNKDDILDASPDRVEEKEKNGSDVKNEPSEKALIIEANTPESVGETEEKAADNFMVSATEWDIMYATKKKEEVWMKSIVVFASSIVIIMAFIMGQKGVQSLKGTLYDSQTSLNYAGSILTEGANAVDELANGLQSFQSDVLNLLERTNKGLCPMLKPKGFCERVLEVDSCDFTIQIDLEKNITIDRLDIDKSIDTSYNYSVDVSELAESIKQKIGLDGTLDLRQVLFPNAPQVYQDTIELFSRDWVVIEKMENVADIINNVAALTTQTEEQTDMIEWVFYIAVAFDIIVGVLAACMIFHILAGDRLPQPLKCLQRRCLFPFFIACVSLAFIFAIAFLIASMALSDTCIDDPNQRILTIARHYLGDGLAADFVLDFVKDWLSQCSKEPPSIQADQVFLNRAQLILEQFDSALRGFSESATEFCGTSDPTLFSDIIASSVKLLCGAIGLTLDVRKIFKCSTWMPLYYNTVYNALCYNGIDGVWSIAATQFTTVLMACIILTFRAVFFDLEVGESNDSAKSIDAVMSSQCIGESNNENSKSIEIETEEQPDKTVPL